MAHIGMAAKKHKMRRRRTRKKHKGKHKDGPKDKPDDEEVTLRDSLHRTSPDPRLD